MNSNLTKLEFNKILDILSTYCKTYIGKDLCNSILPSNKTDEVKCLLAETSEAYELTCKYGNLPMDEIEDITPYLKNLESYIPLGSKALLEIAKILKVSGNLKDYFHNSEIYEKSKEVESSNSFLLEKFEALYSNPGIYEEITKSIIDENYSRQDK